MINELLLALILSTSFSVRTPNDDTKPLDYEFSVKAEKNEGNFTYNAKRDWERELGTEYVDDVISFNHKFKFLYYGVDYINKESKDIFYTTHNTGIQHSSGLKVGLSFKEDVVLLSTGFNKKLKKDDLEYNIKLSFKSNFDDSDIYSIKSELKKWFGRFNILVCINTNIITKEKTFNLKSVLE